MNIKQTSISQNTYPSKRLSRRKRNNALQFPNTVLLQSEPLTDGKDLHKASSRSIKLSRKCDLLQMKESQTKHKDTFALSPKIVAISSVMNKPVVSLPSQSFHDIANTISTVSILSSMSSFKTENKKSFGNIVNRKKLVSSTSSNHLHSSNSEYEINVLHYENDILPGNNFPQFAQSHLKSINTKWSSAHNCNAAKIQADNDNLADKRNVIKRHKWNEDKTANDIKYSREIDNWMPPSQREESDAREIKIIKRNGKHPYDCKIKYSWQVIGTSTQTSYTLLQDLLNSDMEDKSAYKMCSIKYSWQIVGISTQASLHDYNDQDYWSGILLTPNKNCDANIVKIDNYEKDDKLQDYARYPEKKLEKYLILNNQQTQTFSEKEIQADPNDSHAKYSWHDLIKQYL